MNNGKSLTIVLLDKGLKKKDFAEGMHVSNATVSTLCKNKAWSGRMLVRVCDFLEIKPSDFIALGE